MCSAHRCQHPRNKGQLMGTIHWMVDQLWASDHHTGSLWSMIANIIQLFSAVNLVESVFWHLLVDLSIDRRAAPAHIRQPQRINVRSITRQEIITSCNWRIPCNPLVTFDLTYLLFSTVIEIHHHPVLTFRSFGPMFPVNDQLNIYPFLMKSSTPLPSWGPFSIRG